MITYVLILREKKVGQKHRGSKTGYFSSQINSVVNLFYISKKWDKTLYLINFEIKVIKQI